MGLRPEPAATARVETMNCANAKKILEFYRMVIMGTSLYLILYIMILQLVGLHPAFSQGVLGKNNILFSRECILVRDQGKCTHCGPSSVCIDGIGNFEGFQSCVSSCSKAKDSKSKNTVPAPEALVAPKPRGPEIDWSTNEVIKKQVCHVCTKIAFRTGPAEETRLRSLTAFTDCVASWSKKVIGTIFPDSHCERAITAFKRGTSSAPEISESYCTGVTEPAQKACINASVEDIKRNPKLIDLNSEAASPSPKKPASQPRR
jgi:hypothetical protein